MTSPHVLRLFLVVLFALPLTACAGREEARRTALLLAEATDSYIREVSAKITSEQRFYDKSRQDFEGQLKAEDDNARAWETLQPSFDLLDLVEQMAKDESRLRVPGDFYGSLLEVNRIHEERAKKIAESKAAFRKTYELDLARLDFKRSELDRVRVLLEGLGAELSLKQRAEFIFHFAKETKDALDKKGSAASTTQAPTATGTPPAAAK